jgi:hypothetical protein
MANTLLLPAMQFGREYSTLPDGKKVYLTTAGKLVCEHGECSSTICYWLAIEKKAVGQGKSCPPRGGSRGLSTCDCQTTEGLNAKLYDDILPPASPPSLFAFLEDQGVELAVVKGREARRIPHLPGPVFITSMGKLCCRHGASRQSLIIKQRTSSPSCRLPTCGCELKPLPVRAGSFNGIQLGKYHAKKPVLSDINGARAQECC